MPKLDKQARDALPDSDFAVPGKRVMPIHDATHVKLAWDMVDRAKDLSDKERSEARANILRRAKELGVNTKSWLKDRVQAAFAGGLSINAEQDPEHPNKHYFAGIMTRLDEPSDNAPGGANGKQVILPAAVAEDALDSLLGMAVDFTPDFDGHDKRAKIGFIERAWIEGSALWIEGYFFAADFPDEVKRLSAEQESMGFSYELQALVEDQKATPLVIKACIFTGCAVLYKDKAAYTTTTLSANAGQELDMTKEELQEIVSGAVNTAVETHVKPLAAQVADLASKGVTVQAASVLPVVKPHADALREVASKMEAAGVGAHPKMGHAAVLRDMADHMEAEATLGRIPSTASTTGFYGSGTPVRQEPNGGGEVDPKKVATIVAEAVKAAVEPLQTEMKDLQAKAFNQAAAPERKTVAPEIMALVARAGLVMPEEGAAKLKAADVSAAAKKSGLQPAQIMALKTELSAKGLMD